MRGSHFSRTNCSTAMVVSGRFCLRFLDRRQLARSARASLFEIWLTDPRTFERRTLLRVSSGCSSVSRQRATHIFWPFPLIVKHPFWKRRRTCRTTSLEVRLPSRPVSSPGPEAISGGSLPQSGPPRGKRNKLKNPSIYLKAPENGKTQKLIRKFLQTDAESTKVHPGQGDGTGDSCQLTRRGFPSSEIAAPILASRLLAAFPIGSLLSDSLQGPLPY